METLKDHVYSDIDNYTQVCHILQGIKNYELKAALNVHNAQQEKYGKDIDVITSYLCQMVMKKGANFKSIHIAKIISNPAKPKVLPFTEKVESKKYPRQF